MGLTAKAATKNKSNFTIKQITKQERYYRYFATGLGAFLLAYVVANFLAPVQTSNAYQELSIENTLTNFHLNINPDVATLSIPVSASPSGQLAASKTTVNVETNSPSGYQLYLSTYDADNNIYKDGLVSNSSLGYFSPTSGDLSTPAALGQNQWGFALNKSSGNSYAANFADLSNYNTGTTTPTSGSTWAAVPVSTSPVNILTTSDADYPDGTNIDIYYGVSASTALPSGTYSSKITYTAISEGVNRFETMQNFTAEQCNAMSMNTSINLTDSRDDKYYRVTKLADGHCWMTDNLALDGTDKEGNVRWLTPSDSNVTTNRKLAENITDGTTSVNDAVQIYSGEANTTDTYGTKYGNYYNFMAATAGVGDANSTGTITESVCPKGWRLPDNAGNYSYSNLMGAYDLPTTNATDANAVEKIQQSPLYSPLAGRYYSGMGNQGTVGYHWSRTVYSSSDRAYFLVFGASNGYFSPQYNDYKSYAFSVRCVFEGQSTDYMQNFTVEMCNNLAEDVATTLVDKRDGKTYSVTKFKDGNCWMSQNLALDGTDSATGAVRTLTTADSNVSEDRPLAANIANGTTSNNTSIQIYSGNANATTTSTDYPYAVISDAPYGNLYNWLAATAGTGSAATTGTAFESVCPKGWRLPDSSAASGLKSYTNLVKAYNLGDGTNTTNGAYVQALQKSPLNFSLAGVYFNSATGQGNYSIYWSRTSAQDMATNAYDLSLTSSNGILHPQGSYAKSYSAPIRCVFYGDDISNVTYMQDMTTDICNKMSEGATKTLLDPRGSYNTTTAASYGIIKAKDGNCWMTTNFNLYNTTIYAASSDLSTGSYKIENTSNWTGDVYTSPKVHRATNANYADQVYYNWTAAVALTDGSTTTQQNQSLCPKNWQLPINGDDTTNKSWAKLLKDQNNITTGSALLSSALGFTQYYGFWAWDNNSEYNQGTYGNFWSSTPNGANNSRNLAYNSSAVDPQSSSSKSHGFSIRCVSR